MKVPCGWCIDGVHDKCVGAIRSPQGGLWFCDHPDRQPTLRCVDCGNKTPGEVDPEIWECTGEHRRRERPKKVTPKQLDGLSTSILRAGPKCLCCGEPTKGGKFLPGHDSRYLTNITKNIAGEDGTPHTLDEWLAKMQEYGCSESLQAKLVKRVKNA